MVDTRRQRQRLLDEEKSQDEDNGVGYFAGETRGCKAEEQVASPGPQFRENVVVNECDVLDLAVDTVEELELGLGAAISLLVRVASASQRLLRIQTQKPYLTLVVDLLRNLMLEDLGRLGSLENLVLAQTKEALE